MNDSTRRALRTGFHVLVALLTAIPAIVAGLPSLAVGAQVLVVAAGVSKAINLAEEVGLVPAWLKGDTKAPVVVAKASASADVDGATDPDGPTAD